MVSSSRPHHRYTYAQYAALERESSTKHEFFDGEIYAMGGRSEDHAALAANVIAALGIALGDRPCRVLTSDLRVYIEAARPRPVPGCPDFTILGLLVGR